MKTCDQIRAVLLTDYIDGELDIETKKDIDKHLKESGSKTRMLLQVHDELLFEVPDNEMSGIAPLVKQLMENAMKLDVPIAVEMKAGANWNEMEKLKI